jgi:hypothetical protein
MLLRQPGLLDSLDLRTSRLGLRLLACLAGLLAVGYYFLSTGPFQFPLDDSYITLEFARNFAWLHRFTYDGIHAAPGATSPLHVLLLALVTRLGLPLEAADATLGVVFFLLAVERTGALAWRLTQSKRAMLVSAGLTALSGYLVYDSLNGLETTLFIFLVVAWVESLVASAQTQQVSRGAVLWLFLAVLTRPEALWLAASAGLYFLVRAIRSPGERARLLTLLVSLAAAGALALLTQWMLMGSPFPHTALAKMYLFGDYRKPLGMRLSIFWYGLRMVWNPLYFFLLLAIWAQRTRIILWLLFPWLVITEASFCLLLPGQVETYWGRYQHPLMPFVFLLAGDGLERLSEWLKKYRVGSVARIFALGLVIALCGINLRELAGELRDDKGIIRDNHFWAVKWLERHAPADARIATHDIGVLRYVGGYNLLDLSGLTNPQAFERNRAAQGQFDYLAQQRPDYLIGIDFWLEGYLHYFPQLDCCATRVAHAIPRTPTTIRLSIYRCHWEGLRATAPPSAEGSGRR